MRLGRGRFLAATTAAAGSPWIVQFPGNAAEFTYRWAIDVAPAHQIGARSIEAGAKITQDSSGRLEVKVFPQSILGGQTQVLGQVRLGAIEMCDAGDFLLENIAPIAALSTIPFAFRTHQEAWKAMDGPLGSYTRGAVEKAGVRLFETVWDAGFRQMFNSLRPIRTAADVRGLKVRIPDSPVWLALFKGLGMTPTAVTNAEIYTSLQTHLLDACELPLVAFQTLKLFEVQKYGSLTGHAWGAYRQVVNPDSWQRLPANLRDIMDRNVNAAAIKCREDSVRADETLLSQIKNEGITINDCDVNSFKTAVKATGLYAQWRQTYGPQAWGILERAAGRLG
jgi:tripartite ATP-independent transporter DctP family solute receptor